MKFSLALESRYSSPSKIASQIKEMIRNPSNPNDHIIQDSRGHLYRLDVKTKVVEEILRFHAGPIAGICTSPIHHCLTSLGQDGTLRLYDYLDMNQLNLTSYPTAGTFLQHLPELMDETGRTLACGFEDGVVRIVSYEKPSAKEVIQPFKLQFVFKPHQHPVTCIEFNEEGDRMATIDSSGCIFFFEITRITDKTDDEGPRDFSRRDFAFTPIGFVQMDSPVTSFSFSPDNHRHVGVIEDPDDEYSFQNTGESESGNRILVTMSTGELLSMKLLSPREFDNRLSYELSQKVLSVSPWSLNNFEETVTDSQQPQEKLEKSIEDSEDGDATEANAVAIESIDRSRYFFRMVKYLEGGYFVAVFSTSAGDSQVRICKHENPSASRFVCRIVTAFGRLSFVHSSEISDIKISKTGKYFLLAGADGMTALRKLTFEELSLKTWSEHEHFSNPSKTNESAECYEDVYNGSYWCGFAHKSQNGRIPSICSAYDDSFVFSAGEDGGFFVWRNLMDAITGPESESLILNISS